MGQFGIGQPVPRTEDPRLLRGEGRFIGDFKLADMAYGYVLRSPHANARIKSLDASKAWTVPGVLDVLTHKEIMADGIGHTVCHIPRKRPDGSPMHQTPHPGLVGDQARFAGDQVAYVVGETLDIAKSAAELIEVEYEPLPVCVSTADSVEPGAVAVWDDCPDNVAFVYEEGDAAAADAQIGKAKHIIRQRFNIPRLIANAMEPRGAIGDYDRLEQRFTLYGSIGTPHSVRKTFANEIFRVPENQFRVVAGDVGGAFGAKGNISTENLLTLWAAKRVGRPVKWIGERSECFLSDDHSRDNVSDGELALDEDGNILALRVHTLCNLGAYLSSDRTILSTFGNLGTLAGVYTIPAIYVNVRGVYTNMSCTATYRGAGRPEACYVIEGLIDRAARELGMDPAEIRRRNTIPVDAFPYKTALTFTYDCGEFEKNLDGALMMADYKGFEARRADAARRGTLRGIGIANSIERASAPSAETAEIRFDPSGTVTLFVGTRSQGQGHDTMYKILLSDRLGIDSDDVRLAQGDTDQVAFGIGTFGSRSAVLGGSATVQAADKIVEKGKKIAAHLMEAAEDDIEFDRGTFTVAGTDKSVSLKDVAQAAFNPMRLPKGIEPGLYETATYSQPVNTYPNGCHVCEVEIDPDTGITRILKYSVVDDVGTVINALTLKGQIHGGVVQGVGEALMEQVVYDPETGQLTSGSFMDYAMPRADDVCQFDVESNPVPTATNPLGAKGCGEAGTVGAVPAVMNAVLDALAPLGIRHVEMPATPERLWRMIREARAEAA